MNRKTTTTLVLFLALLGVAYYVISRPEKGQRTGERPRPIAKLELKAVQEIALTSKGSTVSLVRGEKDTWRLHQPVDYPADKYGLDSLTEKLDKLEFGDLVTEKKDRHAELQVDEKSGIHVVLTDAKKKTLADFFLGKTEGDFTMLRPAGQDAVFQAVGSLRFVFDREAKNWRNRTIVELKGEQARGLEVTTAAGSIALARPDEKTPWRVDRSPLKIDQLDQGTVSSLLTTLQALSAFDFADGITPEKSGLDAPAARIKASLQGGAAVTLLVGKLEGDDYLVQKEGAPQVFKVKKHSMENLLRRPIDFRDKTVLSFKAEDVVSVTLNRVKDKAKVTLALKGTEWLADGKKPKDASKIKPAVDTLAALKAEGFSTATAQELGLDQPDWTVEILLKDRTRHRLTVGSTEKDGVYGLTRAGVAEIFTLRKFTLDRFCLDPASLKP